MNGEPDAPNRGARSAPEDGDAPSPPVYRSPFTVHWVQVTTTCDSESTAETIARLVVEERLAACAQIAGPITSLYRWEGRVERAAEWYCHMKTTVARLPELESRIRSSHPYSVPEIIAFPVFGGSAEYLSWIEAQVIRKE